MTGPADWECVDGISQPNNHLCNHKYFDLHVRVGRTTSLVCQKISYMEFWYSKPLIHNYKKLSWYDCISARVKECYKQTYNYMISYSI